MKILLTTLLTIGTLIGSYATAKQERNISLTSSQSQTQNAPEKNRQHHQEMHHNQKKHKHHKHKHHKDKHHVNHND